MKKEEMIGTAMIVVGCIILVPIVVNAGISLINMTYCGIGNAINRAKFNKRIKQGLKDGSIVEIDGQYYEVQLDETVEEA